MWKVTESPALAAGPCSQSGPWGQREGQGAPPPPGSPQGVARTPAPPGRPPEGGGAFTSLFTPTLEKV